MRQVRPSELTPDAIELGLAAALPAVFELSCSIAEFGRGERSQDDDFDEIELIRSAIRRARRETRQVCGWGGGPPGP